MTSKKYLPEVRPVGRPIRVAGPRERFDDDAVGAEVLLGGRAGVEVVEAHRARRIGGARRGGSTDEDQHGADERRERAPGLGLLALGLIGARLVHAQRPTPNAQRRRHLVSLLYLIRCGISAAAPSRRFRSAS